MNAVLRTAGSVDVGAKKRARQAAHAENQRAHVQRRKMLVKTLEVDVGALTVETVYLERQLLRASSTLNETRPEKLVMEYIKMFHFGYQSSHPTQLSFIRSFMREDICAHGIIGLPFFIDNFRRYCSVNLNFQMDYVHSHFVYNDECDGLVLGRCVLQLMVKQRISRGLLELYYPGVLNNEPLVQSLIGQTIRIPSTSDFTFDTDGLISVYASSMELVRAFVDLVHDVEVAAMIVHGNRLHPRNFVRA
ncbi:hypothetical protein DYB26_001834 [Aphanomyces astaci]|uniref:BZIP domain-containing protein n=1 Tax=Aphanomyces astaci TaxID=112090 RepID=A0A418D6E2_APHAT|nr:hypothetical protein DYB26_001834 [Aphanomyces astaci]